jgi:hypothetical protein
MYTLHVRKSRRHYSRIETVFVAVDVDVRETRELSALWAVTMPSDQNFAWKNTIVTEKKTKNATKSGDLTQTFA